MGGERGGETASFINSKFTEMILPSESTRLQLVEVSEERDRLRREKEEEVATLNGKLEATERSYEAILQVNHSRSCMSTFANFKVREEVGEEREKERCYLVSRLDLHLLHSTFYANEKYRLVYFFLYSTKNRSGAC